MYHNVNSCSTNLEQMGPMGTEIIIAAQRQFSVSVVSSSHLNPSSYSSYSCLTLIWGAWGERERERERERESENENIFFCLS